MPRSPGSPRTKAVVMIVEDEPVLRTLFVEALAEEGFQVLEAAHGCDALHSIRSARTHVDLVVTDIQLPDVAGPDLIRQAREILPELRVLYISGAIPSSLQSAQEDARMTLFMQKPFGLSVLLQRVRDLLERE